MPNQNWEDQDQDQLGELGTGNWELGGEGEMALTHSPWLRRERDQRRQNKIIGYV
jgi:hypothetical protein